MQYVEHTDAKRWTVVYLKFKCNWESYILSGNTTLGILQRWDVYCKIKEHLKVA